MSGDPFDFRCRTCGSPLLDDVEYCHVPCRSARQVWAELGDRIRRGLRRWLEAEAATVPPPAPAGGVLWWVRFDQVDTAGRRVLRDWLLLHGITASDLAGAYLEVTRRLGATVLEVFGRTGTACVPLIWEPPYLSAAHAHGFIGARDITVAQPRAVAG